MSEQENMQHSNQNFEIYEKCQKYGIFLIFWIVRVYMKFHWFISMLNDDLTLFHIIGIISLEKCSIYKI